MAVRQGRKVRLNLPKVHEGAFGQGKGFPIRHQPTFTKPKVAPKTGAKAASKAAPTRKASRDSYSVVIRPTGIKTYDVR